MTVKDLKKKAPKGEFLAYINKEEAAALKRAGGSGHLVNGIPSFVGSDYSQDPDSKGNVGTNTSGYQGGMRGPGGYQGSTGETNKTKSEGGSGTGNFTNPKAATDETNQAIKERDAEIKERARQKTIQDFTDRRTLKEKIKQGIKVRNLKWSTIQKQKQRKAIDEFLEEEYEISKYGNPRMIDIEEVREQLMSQYDPKTNTMKGLEGFNTGKPGMNFGKTQLGPLGLKTTDAKGKPLGTKYLDQTPSLYSRIELPGVLGKVQGKKSINNLMSGFNKINQLTEIQKDGVTQNEITDYYDKAMGRGKYDIFGGDGGDGGDNNQPFIPINYNTGAAEIVEPYNQFTYRMGDDQDVIYDSYGTPGYRTTAADGGIMGTRARRAMGGIMNRVDKRQQFFLGGIGKAVGKVVGGVAKAAGKVLSSDLGKAALAGAAFYYGGGGGNPFTAAGRSSFSAPSFFSKSNPLLFSGKMVDGVSKQVFNPFKFAGLTTLIGAGMGPAKVDTLEGFSDRGGKMKDSKGNDAVGTDIRAEIDDAYESGDPERIAAIEKYYAFLPPTKKFMPYQEFGDEGYRTTVATGGRIGFNGGGTTITLMDGTTVKIPSGSYNSSGSLKDKIYSSSKGDLLREEIIRKLSFANGGRIGRAEGGLMDLGGMEKDYRAEGGFVPIGEYEKKDDVPARLSVNEFVFTADAVRGAGQGDIDKGAEIMENMMKNLENGGTVSEESQGNNGAQQMFETSERLGEIL